jgi:isoaspartyl peptidase/L-asparaginase-like protein (Ntn-hydrolase superfamily)
MIAIDPKGNIAMEFNSERMHRSWKTSDGDEGTKIYND